MDRCLQMFASPATDGLQLNTQPAKNDYLSLQSAELSTNGRSAGVKRKIFLKVFFFQEAKGKKKKKLKHSSNGEIPCSHTPLKWGTEESYKTWKGRSIPVIFQM